MLFKEIVDARTDARTHDGRQTLKDHKSSLSTSCSGELKMFKFDNTTSYNIKNIAQLKNNDKQLK